MFKRTRERPKAPIEVDPTVPKMLSDITVKCLEMDANARYQSAREILNDLEIWRGGGTKAFATSVGTTAGATVQPVVVPAADGSKKWIAAGVAGIVLVLGVAGFAFRGRLFSGSPGTAAVSYTHLDVYKRQVAVTVFDEPSITETLFDPLLAT